MNNDSLRKRAEEYVETQLRTLKEMGSEPSVSAEEHEELVVSAMKAAGYEGGLEV